MITHRKLRWGPFWWACAIALTLYVVVEALLPPKLETNLHLNDKIEHAGAFWAMTFWFGGLVARRRFVWLIVVMLALGAGIEFAQGAMALGRTEDIKDFLADSVGVALAVIPAWFGLDSWLVYLERRLGIS